MKKTVRPPKHDAVPVADVRSPLTNSVYVPAAPTGKDRLTATGPVAWTVTAAVVFGTAAFATDETSNRYTPAGTLHCPVSIAHALPDVVVVKLIEPTLLKGFVPVGMTVGPMNT